MNKQLISFRCPKCGKVLEPSDNPEYVFQCMDCDEDFYNFEADKITISFSTPTQPDMDSFTGSGMDIDLSIHTKLNIENEAGDHATLFVTNDEVEKLGHSYIKDHVTMTYNKWLDTWFAFLSHNDFHNDLNRNPEKVIKVDFVEVEANTGREVYKGIETGRYYLREVSSREPFAKWLVCGKHRKQDDGSEPRANLIFQCGDQQEKVIYDGWNGVAAYESVFNQHFRKSRV